MRFAESRPAKFRTTRMGIMLVAIAVFFGEPSMSFELNYDEFMPLDAEDLAETGIASAYQELLPALKKYVKAPAELREITDPDDPSYSVACLGKEYFIYGGDDQQESWGRATYAFFDIVNRQLEGTPYRFFAINGGNDLGGMFLKPADAEKARKSLPKKSDWPYLPANKAPWYGMYH